MTQITEPQMEALKLFPEGYLLTDGRTKYGRLFAQLAKMGLVVFAGHEHGKRKWRLTEAGRRAILAGKAQ